VHEKLQHSDGSPQRSPGAEHVAEQALSTQKRAPQQSRSFAQGSPSMPHAAAHTPFVVSQLLEQQSVLCAHG
jgi:hypothetical protein